MNGLDKSMPLNCLVKETFLATRLLKLKHVYLNLIDSMHPVKLVVVVFTVLPKSASVYCYSGNYKYCICQIITTCIYSSTVNVLHLPVNSI